MRTSSLLGILAFFGLVGGISLLSEKLENPKQNVKKEVQITARCPISVLRLKEQGSNLAYKIEHTGIEGVPSDPYSKSEGYTHDIEIEYTNARVRHSVTGGIKFYDGGANQGSRKIPLYFEVRTPDYGKPKSITITDRESKKTYSALESSSLTE